MLTDSHSSPESRSPLDACQRYANERQVNAVMEETAHDHGA